MSIRRTVPLIFALSILAYLFALLVPIIPVQQFIRCTGGFGCPLTFTHDTPVAGGFTRTFLNSITRQLTGFGAYYNTDEGYNLPTGPYAQGIGYLTGFGVLAIIVLPLCLAAVASLALAFRNRTGTRIL